MKGKAGSSRTANTMARTLNVPEVPNRSRRLGRASGKIRPPAAVPA